MSRIVGFCGASAGAGATTVCCALAKELARRNEGRICAIDFNFRMNDLSQRFLAEAKFDLKDFLLGRINAGGICQKESENLYFIKSNAPRFDYMKFSGNIKDLIKDISAEFEYIFIDINCFDEENFKLAKTVMTEAFLIFENSEISIKLAARTMQKFNLKNNKIDVKLLFNKSKIIGQIKRKYLDIFDVESVLGREVFFEFPLFFKYNKNTGSERQVLLQKTVKEFCNSFITNKPIKINYKKTYFGLIGKIKRRFYERFE